MYAVIQTSGRQYRVSEGDVITVYGFEGKPGDVIEFPEVLLLEKDGQVKAGAKQNAGAKVQGRVAGHPASTGTASARTGPGPRVRASS
jgi:large subunit ribosomal protein L21